MEVVGTENFDYDFDTGVVTLLRDEDIVAYKLKFPAPDNTTVTYRSVNLTVDTGYYYCPYIPPLNPPKNDKED